MLVQLDLTTLPAGRDHATASIADCNHRRQLIRMCTGRLSPYYEFCTRTVIDDAMAANTDMDVPVKVQRGGCNDVIRVILKRCRQHSGCCDGSIVVCPTPSTRSCSAISPLGVGHNLIPNIVELHIEPELHHIHIAHDSCSSTNSNKSL